MGSSSPLLRASPPANQKKGVEGEYFALVIFQSDGGKCVLDRKRNLLHGEGDIGSN